MARGGASSAKRRFGAAAAFALLGLGLLSGVANAWDESPSPTPSYSRTATRTATRSPSGSNTPSNSPTASNTPSVSRSPSSSVTKTRTPSNTRTGTRTPSHTPSHTPTISNTPSNSPTPSITPSPLVCKNPDRPISVELFSNIHHDESFGDGLTPLLVPFHQFQDLAQEDDFRRQLHSAPAAVEHHVGGGLPYPYENGTYGGAVLTDQQRVAIQFEPPCSSAHLYPCSFCLRRLSVVLRNLVPHHLRWTTLARVSFKIELGRYYTNTVSSRMLSGGSSAVYVDFQSTIWTEPFLVGPDPAIYHLDLSGLCYSTYAPTRGVTPGDMKLVITPYIHYDSDTSCPDQILWMLTTPPEDSFPDSPFDFGNATSFNMLPGCPSRVGSLLSNSRVLSLAEATESAQLDESSGALVVAGGARELNNGGNWWPDVCVGSDSWSCVPFFPSIDLEAEIPCYIVFERVDALFIFLQAGGGMDDFHGESRRLASREPMKMMRARGLLKNPASWAPAVDNSRALALTSAGLEESLKTVTPKVDPAAARERMLHSGHWFDWHYPAFDCPPSWESDTEPFFGADTTAFGRYVSEDVDAIRTVEIADTTGRTELLFLFKAPCTHCNIYLRNLWLPLAKDIHCSSEIHFYTTLGIWVAGNATDEWYPLRAFIPSPYSNGAHTLVTDLTYQLNQVGLWLGNTNSPARIDIPFIPGRSVWLGIRVAATSCFRLGTGLTNHSQHICPEARITPADLLVGHNYGAGVVTWRNTYEVPGIFAPVIKVEPWAPFCVPFPPAPSHSPAASLPPPASASPTRSRILAAGSRVPGGSPGIGGGGVGGFSTGEFPSGSYNTGEAGGYPGGGIVSGANSDGLSAGAIAGIVIGALAFVGLVVGAALYGRSRTAAAA